MTLYLERPVANAGLHALVIGVANYPHLIDGTGKLAANPFGLKQVKAPYATALAIADWLETRYRSSTQPLASIDLLISPPPSAPALPDNVKPATMDNIVTAFHAWRARASANPDNFAFFYFCGHGLSQNSQLLLAQDFGNDPNPFVKSVDFDGTLPAMNECDARTQVYFIDACRNAPAILNQPLMKPLAIKGETLLIPTRPPRRTPELAVYYAADEGEESYAPTDGSPTYFSTALLTCLENGCSTDKRGRWVADTGKLTEAFQRVLNRIARLKNVPRLTVRVGKYTDVAQLNEVSKPSVWTWLDCRTPLARLESAMLMMNMRDHRDRHRSARGEERPWLCQVNPGWWRVDALFNNHPRYKAKDVPLFPPCEEHEIDR